MFCAGTADSGNRDVSAQLGLSVCGWHRLRRDPRQSMARARPSAGGQRHRPQQHRAHEGVHAGGHRIHLPGHRESRPARTRCVS